MKFTIIRDTREKNGWQFNKSSWCHGTENTAMKTGDYCIKEAPQLICIERKASVGELCTNFLMERARLYNEMDRIQEFDHKFIIVECTLDDIFHNFNYRFLKNKSTQRSAPKIIMGSLVSFSLKYDVNVVFAGSKGKNYASCVMKKAWQYYCEGKKNES